MKTHAQLLGEVQTLLRLGWSKGAIARDAQGRPVSDRSPIARSFCVSAAVGRVYSLDPDQHEYAAVDLLVETLPKPMPLLEFNDHPDRTFAEIDAWLTRTISLAQQKGL